MGQVIQSVDMSIPHEYHEEMKEQNSESYKHKVSASFVAKLTETNKKT